MPLTAELAVDARSARGLNESLGIECVKSGWHSHYDQWDVCSATEWAGVHVGDTTMEQGELQKACMAMHKLCC